MIRQRISSCIFHGNILIKVILLTCLECAAAASFWGLRHTGHVACNSSHGVIHSLWNMCSHWSWLTISSSLKSSQQTEHCAFWSVNKNIIFSRGKTYCKYIYNSTFLPIDVISSIFTHQYAALWPESGVNYLYHLFPF